MFISNAQELESEIENSKFLLATYKLDAGISSLFVILTKKYGIANSEFIILYGMDSKMSGMLPFNIVNPNA
jgi:aminopeptidase C